MVKKHFLTFYSPGTFFPEETTKPIPSWDTERAWEMSLSVVERHGAKPYAFCFTTRERSEDELDSRVTARSGVYHLGGRVLTLEEVRAHPELKNNRVLLSNMESNGIDRVVINTNSYMQISPFRDGDTLLTRSETGTLLEWKP